MPTEKNSVRIDFVQKDFKIDKKTGKFQGTLIPNPERYEWRDINGGKHLYDKFDNILFPPAILDQLFNQTKDVPIYFSPPKIKDIYEYVKERAPKIKEFLENGKSGYKFVDKSEEFLESRKNDKMKFVIFSFDLMGSTKLSEQLSDVDYAKVIALVSKEMSSIISGFNGFILKFVGDGIIAYFPEPNFIGMNDNAVDCAVAIKILFKKAINEILKEKNLPQLKFRIGLDSGEAIIKNIGDSSSKSHKDLIGLTVNLASKIQSTAGENQIVIGDTTNKNLHLNWRKSFKVYNPEDWDYTISGEKSPYPLHVFDFPEEKL